ncbi:MAG: tetratricopeptide repeat protein [Melioribacter sp.]|nr:tetratricopeptide repeat protein [Melioribacter sp.]
MSEMLGNYHFLNRNYSSALLELESSFLKNPNDTCTRKKLIVCYTQTKNLNKAIDLFIALLDENADCIINTKPEEDGCPCPELVSQLECGKIDRSNQYELFVELGILWLYCNIESSLRYFVKAYQINSSDKRLTQIIQTLNSKTKE